jgi:branched-chain amino acid transport system substrate-binding protein
MACSQAGLPAVASSKEFQDAFHAKYGEIKQYAPYFYDGTMAIIEAMKKANSVDPAKFAPEIFNVSFQGATGKVEFDAKGDRKDAEMTIFRMGKDGKIAPVAIVKGGVSTPFAAPSAAAPAVAAPAATPPAAPAAAPAGPAKEAAKKDDDKKKKKGGC